MFKNTVRVVKSRRLRWTEHVARMEGAFNIVTGEPIGKRTLERQWEALLELFLNK